MPWAKVKVTPEAGDLHIVDLATGKDFEGVIEVDSEAGWLIRYKRDSEGNPIVNEGELETEKLEGLRLRIDIYSGARRREWKPKQWVGSHIWSEWS